MEFFNTKKVCTPITKEEVLSLQVGDIISVFGNVLCGRDSVLPRITKLLEEGVDIGFPLEGYAVFHTAVSSAGLGPTSSNKAEIESSIIPLSKAGIRLHIGKGRLHQETLDTLPLYDAVYAVIPPVTALLESRIINKKMLAYPELGMEALYLIEVKGLQIIIAAAHGRSIYE